MKSLLREVAWGRVGYGALSVLAAFVLTPYLLPWYHDNTNARSVLVTVFSILAGFLVAVMAIVADDRALSGRNWRQDTFLLRSVRSQLIRHRWLFQLYLMILVLCFVDALRPCWSMSFEIWSERLTLFLSIIGVALSFSLPNQLTRRHLDRLKGAIRDRRDRDSF